MVAIGNAGGTGGTPSVVTGSVTDTNQSITASDESGSNAEQLSGLIQTDAPSSPATRAGRWSTPQGQVIGMDTAASSANQFMSQNSAGFAIPINHALDIAKQIAAGKASRHHPHRRHRLPRRRDGRPPRRRSQRHRPRAATATASVAAAARATARAAAAAARPTAAVGVSAGVVGSPADKAGLAAGDTITSFDGATVTTADSLTTLTHKHHPGDQVSISWTD